MNTAWIQSAALLLGLALVATASPAEAQFALDTYRGAETSEDGFGVSRPIDGGHLRFGALAHLDYAHDPLVAIDGADARVSSVVEHELVLRATLSFGLFDRVLLFASLPGVLLMEGEPSPRPDLPAAEGAGLGDVTVGARVRLFGEASELGALALSFAVDAPTARAADGAQVYRGEDGVTLSPEILGEVRPIPELRITANVGGRFRTGAALPSLALGQQLTFGAAITGEVAPRILQLTAELLGTHDFSGQARFAPTTLELLGGVRVSPDVPGLWIGLAAGPGFARGAGNPDVRAVLSVGYLSPTAPAPALDEPAAELAPDEGAPIELRSAFVAAEATTPAEGEPEAAPREGEGAAEAEGEGAVDAEGEGAAEAEGEGEGEGALATRQISGPTVGDRDGDLVPDAADACPDRPEDFDEIEDEDGCPEADADDDSIADEADRCPTTPGVAAGEDHPECQGCPATACLAETGEIQILDRVVFESGSDALRPESERVLTDVASILSSNPQIRRVSIEGHTDTRGRDSENMRLSAARARSVAAWLTAHGIDAGRLEAWGCGETRPLHRPERSAADREGNRRVTFQILEPASAATPSTGACQAAR